MSGFTLYIVVFGVTLGFGVISVWWTRRDHRRDMAAIKEDEDSKEMIELGGDTDTNCSIAGQIAGSLIGMVGIPEELLIKLRALKEYEWIKSTIIKFKRNNNCYVTMVIAK